MNHQHRHFAVPVLMFCAAAFLHANPIGQPGEGVQVSMDWHTKAEPTYGAALRYTVSNTTISTGNDSSAPALLNLRLTQAAVGIFELMSEPIDVPNTGMSLSYTRAVEMRPSDAERGTMLSNDPYDRRKYDTFGVTRAALSVHVMIVDATTDKSLAEVDTYRFSISRRQELNDVVDNSRVTIDLTPFAGRRVLIKMMAFPAYNGRGCVTGSIPALSTIHGTTPDSQDHR